MEAKFNKVDIDTLGKFKVEGNGVILNLIGYLVLPEFQYDHKIIIDNEYPIAFFIGYSNDERPYLGFRANKEDLVSRNYCDYKELGETNKTIIDSNKNHINKKDIEDSLQSTLIESINDCKTEINKVCTKWPQRNKYLKVLKEIEESKDKLLLEKDSLKIDKWPAYKENIRRIEIYISSSPKDFIKVVKKDILE